MSEFHPLHRAALDGDIESLRRLIASGAKVDWDRGEDDWTALHFAAMGDRIEAASFLMEHGADPDCRDRYRMTPFDTAVQHGAAQVAGLLYDVKMKGEPDRCGTILHAAVILGLDELAAAELTAGTDPNKGGEDGSRPLHAVLNTHDAPERLARLILHRRRGLTTGPSSLAGKRCPFAKLLLGAGADPLLPDQAGWSPIRIAVHDGHLDLLGLFLDGGARLDDEIKADCLVDAAAHGGQAEAIRFLIKRGMDFQGQRPVGHTPLHTAAWMAFPDCVEALLEAGAEAGVTNHQGLTALGEAERRLAGTEEALGISRLGADDERTREYEETRRRLLRVRELLSRRS